MLKRAACIAIIGVGLYVLAAACAWLYIIVSLCR